MEWLVATHRLGGLLMNTESESRSSLIIWGIGFVLLALAIGAASFILLTRESDVTTVEINPPLPTQTATVTGTPAPLEIYVVGAILTPEARISLPVNSRVEDALDIVGVQDNADLEQVNLAQVLQDGDMIFVPEQNDESAAETTDTNIMTPTPNTVRIVNLNTATVEELETLPGIGPSKAQNIIDYRNENGLFASVDDLVNVSGIGEGTLEELRPYLTIE